MIRPSKDSTALKAPAMRYLKLIGQRIATARKDVAHFVSIGESMAQRCLNGGDLYTPGIARWWAYEFCGRAGGMMGIPHNHELPGGKKDAAYIALRDPRTWKHKEDEKFQALLKAKSAIVVNGNPDELEGIAPLSRFEAFTGGSSIDAGLFGTEKFRPLATLRTFDQFVRGWLPAGEMIAACTRAGRMPIIWMSVWLEGAFARNASMIKQDNLKEPWRPPMFHDKWYVPPLEPGDTSGEFLTALEKIHHLLLGQGAQLAQAGKWFAEASRAGRKPFTVAVGHAYPANLELPADYPIEWGHTISDLSRAIPDKLGKGDVALHLGYAPVNINDIKKILARGIKFIHSSPYGRPAALKDHDNFLWLDLPWRPADATVDVPGYSVRIMPMSSSAHTMAYFSIVAEMAGEIGWV